MKLVATTRSSEEGHRDLRMVNQEDQVKIQYFYSHKEIDPAAVVVFFQVLCDPVKSTPNNELSRELKIVAAQTAPTLVCVRSTVQVFSSAFVMLYAQGTEAY